MVSVIGEANRAHRFTCATHTFQRAPVSRTVNVAVGCLDPLHLLVGQGCEFILPGATGQLSAVLLKEAKLEVGQTFRQIGNPPLHLHIGRRKSYPDIPLVQRGRTDNQWRHARPKLHGPEASLRAGRGVNRTLPLSPNQAGSCTTGRRAAPRGTGLPGLS